MLAYSLEFLLFNFDELRSFVLGSDTFFGFATVLPQVVHFFALEAFVLLFFEFFDGGVDVFWYFSSLSVDIF